MSAVETIAEPKRRGRPPRSEELRSERRRRTTGSIDMSAQLKLAVPVEEQDTRFVYAWINDTPGRLHHYTQQDDYDFVSTDEMPHVSTDTSEGAVGDRISRVVDVDKFGKPVRAFLVKKRRDWYENDREAEAKDRAHQLERQVTDGHVEAEDPGNFYAPKGNKTSTEEALAQRRKANAGVTEYQP